MIVSVTLNASIDKRYVVEGFKKGEVNRVKECSYTPGGKGLNVAKPLAILGAKVVATGFVGGFAGKYIESEVEKLGIRSAFYHLEAESRSCINIWDEEAKEQTEFLEPGFTVDKKEAAGFLPEFEKIIDKASVVTMSGSVPKGIPVSYYRELIKIVKDKGKPVILDTSGELLVEGIKEKPTMIKPNIDEIRMLTGKECKDESEILEAAKALHNSGIKVVVVSLGAKGSLMSCDEGDFKAVVPKIDAVNTVGCGDSMIAGFAKAMEDGLSMKEAMKYASAVSAASAMCEYTGKFLLKDKEDCQKDIKVLQY